MNGTTIRVLSPSAYPTALREIPQVPERLYLRGALPDWSRALVAVVGARHHSDAGKKACEHIVAGLAPYPVTVVSGLAIGLDSIAHEAALRAGIPAVAVLGSGIDDSVLYPRRNRGLAHRILDAGGALIAEMPPLVRATPQSFPRRNRIIAGLSVMAVAVECALRSGTRITAALALEYNREVGAVPHDIFSVVGAGTNELIARGAHVVRSGDDIAAVLGIDAIY